MSDESRTETDRQEEPEQADGGPKLSSQVVVVQTDQVRGVNVILPEGDELLSMLGNAGIDVPGSEIPAASIDEALGQAVLSGGMGEPGRASLEEVPPALVEGSTEGLASLRSTPRDQPWVASRELFVAEAAALAARQPERAALMYMEAVRTGERDGAGLDQVLADLDAALALQPSSLWLLPRARRASMRLRSYERALKIGRREIKLGGESHRCAAVLVESSAVVRYYAGDATMALDLVKQALQIKSGHVPALARTVALSSELQLHDQSAAALEQLGNCLTAARQRALCLYAAGTLLETMLGNVEGARTAYARATEADPQNVPAVAALAGLYELTEEWELFSRTLEHLAELVEDPPARARLLLLAGTVHIDRNDDVDGAARDLSRSARDNPAEPAPLSRLAHAYESKGRVREAVQMLRELLAPELKCDAETRAALLTRVGDLEASLPDEERATAAYKEALEQVPAYLPALEALDVLFRRRGDFESLIAITDPDKEALLPPGPRAVRFVELARVFAAQLQRPAQAIEAYGRAIELDEKLHVAYWEAAALLRDTDRHEELADLLAQQARVCQDPRSRGWLALERARIEAGPLRAPERAVDGLLALDDRGIELPAIARELIDLSHRTGRYGELASLLLDLAGDTSDPVEAQSAKVRAAHVLESKLGEHDRALGILREVIDANPLNHAAVQSAVRILHRQQAWNDLVKLHHLQLVNDPQRPDAALLLCRMGRILAAHLGHGGAAVSAYVKAVRTDGGCTPAILALQGLAPVEGRFDDLAQCLERYAVALKDGRAAAAALVRGAEILCWRLDDLDRAAALLDKAVERHAGAAWSALLRVRLRQRDFVAAAGVLERMVEGAASNVERCLLQLQLARLREFHLGQRPDLVLYQQAASGPFGDRLREELLRVNRLTVESAADNVEMAQRLVELGRQTIDDALAASYMLEAAHTLEFGGSGASGNALLEAATLAYRREPQDFANIWCLERELLRRGMWAELAELAEREAQLELDRMLRVQRLTSAADAYYRAGLTEEVRRVCRECLNFDAHCLPALQLLARIAEESERWRDLAELSDRLAEASADLGNRLQYCLRAAEIWSQRLNDASRALASLAVALADDPGQPDAFQLAERLLRDRGDFDELSRLYQRRIRACGDGEEHDRIELLRQHARLLRDERRMLDRALAAFNELLKIAPDDVSALAELADLHERQGHWSDAANILGALILQATGEAHAAVRLRAQVRQAEMLLRRLHEPKRARAVLEQAAAEAPEANEVRRLLAEVAVSQGDWEDARASLDALVAAASDPGEQVWALLNLAELTRSGAGAPVSQEQREGYLLQVARVASSDSTARMTLHGEIVAARDPLRLLGDIEAVLGGIEDGDAPALGELLARTCIELDQPARAILHLRQLTGGPGGGEPALALLLAQLLAEQGEVTEAAKRYRLLIDRDVGLVEAYRGLSCNASSHRGRAALSVVELLGRLTPPEQERLDALVAACGEPVGTFSSADLELEAGEDRAAFDLIEEALRTLGPFLGPSLFGDGILSAATPASPLDHPTVGAALAVGRCLGVGGVRVALLDDDAGQVTIDEAAETLTLRVPRALADPASAAFRFHVGRALYFGSRAGVAAPVLSGEQLELVFVALADARPQQPAALQLKKALSSRLPRKLRKQVEQLQLGRVAAAACRRYWFALGQRADRLSLVLAREPGPALSDLARREGLDAARPGANERQIALLRFCVSDTWETLCRRIWG